MVPAVLSGNRYDALEWAGAFGDVGTLLPFVIAYVSVVGLDPGGVLFAFGVSMIACGLFYRTPVPVQPMKAAGAAAVSQAAHVAAVTQGTVFAAGLVTGLLWLALGASGLARRLAGCVARPVALGIVLGLGIALVLAGARMMWDDWQVALAAIALVAAGTRFRRVPVMLVLLALGAAWTAWQHPEVLDRIDLRVELNWPPFTWVAIGWNELVAGTLLLALPQMPLTLGNAVIAVRETNNRLFPDRPIEVDQAALSTGFINVFGSAVGGVPMCHGAGGMAGHVAFGARTGGAVVIFGTLLVVLALFLAGSVLALFRMIPAGVLGAVLCVAGLQLARVRDARGLGPRALVVLLVTAALCAWNVAVAFIAGLLLQWLLLQPSRRR